MNKTVYDETLKHLNILNNFVIMWCDEIDLDYHDTYKNNYQKVKKAIEQAQKQEKLLNKIKEIVDRYENSYISSMLTESKRYYEIKELIKELENEK